jgi:DNA-binding response OmpR family regulator
MSRILLIEDDNNVREPLSLYLKSQAYDVVEADGLKKARELLATRTPDLVVLDWNLPDGQGLDLVKECRQKGWQFPIILLTARNDILDKVVSLELGANDYMTKPFEPRELLARVRALLRTVIAPTNPSTSTDLEANGICMKIQDRRVQWQSTLVELTKKEFDLLKLFLENPNKVFSRDELLNLVWGYDEYPNTRTVDNHILKLRQTFREHFFETVRGVGYRFKKES